MLAAGLRGLGVILLALLVLLCVPLTVPRFLGYQVYSVISGSMEPAIPVGSLVYISQMEPGDVQAEDVIAFYGGRDSAAIITHRVVENQVLMGQFITKGDANQAADINPVPYSSFIGKVARSIPHAGSLAEIIAGREGKMAAAGLIIAAVLLQILASLLEEKPKSERGPKEGHKDGR